MSDRLRLLIDKPADGPTNMGRDQALLDGVGQGASPPTLRIYQWAPATISLGYFQSYSDYEALTATAGPLPVVRRVTGGGAILHDAELTYSLTLARSHRLAGGNPACLYDRVHDAVIEAAAGWGVTARRRSACGDAQAVDHEAFFCFSRQHASDVVVGSAKLAGSAQRRTRHALLQHGSIVLADRRGLQESAILGHPPQGDPRRRRLRGRRGAAHAGVRGDLQQPLPGCRARLHRRRDRGLDHAPLPRARPGALAQQARGDAGAQARQHPPLGPPIPRSLPCSSAS